MRHPNGVFRFRYLYMVIGSIIAIISMALTDPDLAIFTDMPYLAGFAATLADLTEFFLYTAMIFLARKGFYDWMDLEEYSTAALEKDPGRVVLSISIFYLAMVILLIVVIKT